MEIDGEGTENGSNVGIDIDGDLLRQFSCMGTNDKNVLINQFLEMVENKVDQTKAIFYLESCDWNLQLALCNYFDLEFARSVTILADVPLPYDGQLTPNSTCVKKWTVQNNERLPEGTTFERIYGECKPIDNLKIEINTQPNSVYEIILLFNTPAEDGVFNNLYKIRVPNGTYLTTNFTFKVSISDKEPLQLAQRMMTCLHEIGYCPDNSACVENSNPFQLPQQTDSQPPPNVDDINMA